MFQPQARTRPFHLDQTARPRERQPSRFHVRPAKTDISRKDIVGRDEFDQRPIRGDDRNPAFADGGDADIAVTIHRKTIEEFIARRAVDRDTRATRASIVGYFTGFGDVELHQTARVGWLSLYQS